MLCHCHTFFSTPEINEVFASFVTKNDIFQCIQVCNSWYDTFLPFLWRSFLDQDKVTNETNHEHKIYYHVNDKSRQSWIKTVFMRHSHLIKNLTTTPEFISYLYNNSSILSPDLPSISPGDPIYSINFDSITLIHEFNDPFGKALKKTCNRGKKTPYGLAFEIWEFFSSQHSLKSLTIQLSSNKEYEETDDYLERFILDLPHLLTSLVELSMDIQSKNIMFPPLLQRFTGTIPLGTVKFIHHRNLKEVILNSPVAVNSIINLLDAAPQLHFLEILSILDRDDLNSMETNLREVPSHLQILRCGDSNKEGCHFLSLVIEFVPNLVEFVGKNLTVELSEAIKDYCKTIKKIIINLAFEDIHNHEIDTTADAITPLLISCQYLDILDAKFMRLDANNVPHQKWVCNGLNRLHCRVSGFEYFSDHEKDVLEKILLKKRWGDLLLEDEDRLFQRYENTREIKRTFFKQVSMMTLLKQLSVSSDSRQRDIRYGAKSMNELPVCYTSERDGSLYFRYSNPPKDGLTMTLDDGLDQLASLTLLEFLGFEFLDHGMDKDEIEWIATSLPRLSSIQGLLDGSQVGLEPNYTNKKLRKLMKSIRKDIIHTRS